MEPSPRAASIRSRSHTPRAGGGKEIRINADGNAVETGAVGSRGAALDDSPIASPATKHPLSSHLLPRADVLESSGDADTSPPTSPCGSVGRLAGGVRWQMAGLALGARLTGQTGRILLGVLMPYVAEETGYSTETKGHILSSFAAGYIFTQILGGQVADCIGAKLPLTVALYAVSVGTLLAPFAVGLGAEALWGVYFLMGLLEGPSFPSVGAFLSKWFPQAEKATANSYAATGGAVGGLLAMGVGPLLALTLGWRAAFAFAGAAGVSFATIWTSWSRDHPGGCAWLLNEERRYLRMRGVAVGDDPPSPLGAALSHSPRRDPAPSSGVLVRPFTACTAAFAAFPWYLFRAPAVWAVCYAHAVYNFGRYFVYAWIPTYFAHVLGAPPATAAAAMACLQIADASVKLTIGRVADAQVAAGNLSVLSLRRLATCAGFLGFSAAMVGCAWAHAAGQFPAATMSPPGATSGPVTATGDAWSASNVALFTTLLTFSKCCSALHVAGFETNYLELSIAHTGALVGVGNSAATAASLLAPMIAGYAISGGGWGSIFMLVAAVNASGAVVYAMFADTVCCDARLA